MNALEEAEVDGWNVKTKHPEVYEAWKQAVAAEETTAGLLIWAITKMPGVIS